MNLFERFYSLLAQEVEAFSDLDLRDPLRAAFYQALQPVKSVLGVTEWAADLDGVCPICDLTPSEGHAAGCVLADLLQELQSPS